MNGLDRGFNRAQPMEVIVSDLTYVKAAVKWNYICVFIVQVQEKNAKLVSSAISTIKHDLRDVQMFQTEGKSSITS